RAEAGTCSGRELKTGYLEFYTFRAHPPQWEASHSVLSRGHASLVVCLPVCQLPLIVPDHLPRRERDVRKSDPNVWWCTTEIPYARPTAASMRAMSAGSRTPRASAVMHSRSSVRFFTPKTTVATPVMD